MKSYHQYCGLARGLDLVGDRWTLLVIRELALGPRRYGQLRTDLAGIPTNLLAARLQMLTAAGLVEPVPGVAGTEGYALTARGFELVPALQAFVRWATPTMLDGPDPDDREDIRWVAFAVTAYLRTAPDGSTVSLRLTCGDDDVRVQVDDGGVTVGLDDDRPTDVTVSATAWALMGVVSGELGLDDLRVVDAAGTVVGSRAARRRVRSLIEHNLAPVAAIR